MARWKVGKAVVAGLLALLLVAMGVVAGCAKPEVTPTPPAEEVTPPPQLEKSPGGYDVVPLEYDVISVAAVQMNPKPVDPENPGPGIQENLEHMLYLCDAAFAWPPALLGPPRKLLGFPEFTLTGFDDTWTREQWLNIAITVPGPETEAIGEKAKELDCYIEFGAHTKDPDWPGHFFNSTVIVSPEGEVIYTFWKPYMGFPGSLEYSTCAHDVLDEFVERYGWEAVWPVARTPVGNISAYTCSSGFAPETARAFALNGAEILIYTIGGGAYNYGPTIGDPRINFQADCARSGVYGIYSNGGSGWHIGGKGVAENACGGGSMVVDPSGTILAKAEDSREQIITATIPIASLRATHQIPNIRTEMYVAAYEQHPGLAPPNLYTMYVEEYGELPPDVLAALQWTLGHSRW